MFTAMFLYEWYTSEINLYYTFGEWQAISWNAIFGNPTFLCVYWLYGIGSAVSADPKAKPCRETAARTLAGEEAAHVMALLKERCPQRKTV